MDVFAFGGLGYAVIGLLLLTLLVVMFISMRKEAFRGEPVQAVLWLCVMVLGLCTVVAFESAYLTTTSLENWRPRSQASVNTADPQ